MFFNQGFWFLRKHFSDQAFLVCIFSYFSAKKWEVQTWTKNF